MNNYFVYLPARQPDPTWPCSVVSSGCSRVAAGSPYPPTRHPVDHHFSWEKGRILHSHTFVFISEGQGVFESAATKGKQTVRAGNVFIVFPEIWHRYAPDPGTGWVEHWLECTGLPLIHAQSAGMIRPDEPVVKVDSELDWLSAFELCHRWAQMPPPVNQEALASLALYILALVHQADKSRDKVRSRIDEVVQRAQLLIGQRYNEPFAMSQLVRELGVGYSYFGEVFKERTGVSPKQYHLQVRLQKAQELLANTTKSVKEVSEILGFDSPYHFSNQFKARTGMAPQIWRQAMLNKQCLG